MAQNDWKVVSLISVGGQTSFWLLSREILLDAPAHALFMENLENLEIKPDK